MLDCCAFISQNNTTKNQKFNKINILFSFASDKLLPYFVYGHKIIGKHQFIIHIIIIKGMLLLFTNYLNYFLINTAYTNCYSIYILKKVYTL